MTHAAVDRIRATADRRVILAYLDATETAHAAISRLVDTHQGRDGTAGLLRERVAAARWAVRARTAVDAEVVTAADRESQVRPARSAVLGATRALDGALSLVDALTAADGGPR